MVIDVVLILIVSLGAYLGYKKGLISQADMIQAEQLADLGIKRLNNYD